MDATFLRGLMPAALCAWACAATAQTPPAAARAADPLDARAAVPPVVYQSVWSRQRRTGDDPAVPWRDANDTVARIGGWRAYAREAQQPAPAASAPTVAPTPRDPSAVPMPQGHAGHKMP